MTSNLELVVSLCLRFFGFACSGGPLGPFLMTFSGLFLCCSSSLELVFLTLFLSAYLSLLPFFHRILLRHFQRETLLTDIFGDQFFGFCVSYCGNIFFFPTRSSILYVLSSAFTKQGFVIFWLVLFFRFYKARFCDFRFVLFFRF